MLLLLVSVMCTVGWVEALATKPLVVSFPIPFELPNRNDRADQCWLRIEDAELTETIAIYCTLAHYFLDDYIPTYNSKKMVEDSVEVSLWYETPRHLGVVKPLPEPQGKVKSWRRTTVMDPTTKKRLYVSKNAICRIIMYSREGMTNYNVDCETILFFINERATSGVYAGAPKLFFLIVTCFSLIFWRQL